MKRLLAQPTQVACFLILCFRFSYVPAIAAEPEEKTEKKADAEKPTALSSAEMILQKESIAQQKLQEKSSFDFDETPLKNVMARLAEQHDIDILLDEQHLADEEVTLDHPLSLKVEGISLQSGLRLLLEPLRLTFVIKEEAILITSAFQAENELLLRIYPVGDLISFEEADGRFRQDGEVLLELIASAIQPNAWDHVGGPGTMKIYQGMLIVSQTGDVLEEIEQLLAALRKFPAWGSPQAKAAPSKVRVTDAGPGNDKCRAALDKVIPLDFDQTSLRDVIAFLREATGVPILVQEIALKDEGVDWELPLTLKCKSLSLRTAMQFALNQHALEFIVRDETLILTSKAVYESEITTILYPVTDVLVLPDSPEAKDISEALFDLAETMSSVLQPNTWDAVGGPGSIQDYFQRGVLIISTTQDVHQEVESFLERLRIGKSQQLGDKLPKPPSLDEMETVVYELIYDPIKINEKSGMPESPAPEHIDTEKLVSLIPKLLGPEVWGEDPDVSIEALADRVVVHHTRRVQRKVYLLLRQLGVWVTDRDPASSHHPQGMGGGQATPQSGGGSGFFNLPADKLPRETK